MGGKRAKKPHSAEHRCSCRGGTPDFLVKTGGSLRMWVVQSVRDWAELILTMQSVAWTEYPHQLVVISFARLY